MYTTEQVCAGLSLNTHAQWYENHNLETVVMNNQVFKRTIEISEEAYQKLTPSEQDSYRQNIDTRTRELDIVSLDLSYLEERYRYSRKPSL